MSEAARPLRIGIDARELQGRPTGTGRYLRNLLREWTRQGADSLVAYFDGPAPDDPVIGHPRVLRRELGRGGTRGLVWLTRLLPAAARADGLDVFFSPAYVCPPRLGTPRVTAVHDLSFVFQPQDFTLLDGLRRRLLVGASIQASAVVLACSEFTRREIRRWAPDAAGRVRHVPLGPDDDLPPPPARDDARDRLALRGPCLLAVGAILNRRRLPVLLRAVALAARRQPGLVLDVVGENRTHPRLDLARLSAAVDLGGSLRLSGFVTEAALADRYAAADVALALSEYEGFGLPALEAMARGVPVVAAARPALDEVCGGAALLVDPGDAPGIAAAIERVLGDAGLRADLVALGRARAAGYSWRRTADLTRQALAAAARAGSAR